LKALILACGLAACATAALAQAPDPSPAAPPQAGVLLQPTPEEQLIGAADVCVRWGADPAHLSDVVMTNSSGDKDLDARIPGMIRDIPYPRPDSDSGEWFGLSLSFGAAEPHKTLPDCAIIMRPTDDKN
jgi:hypothetical protein